MDMSLVCTFTILLLIASAFAADPVIADFDHKLLADKTICGFVKDDRRIFGGTVTYIDEFPWIAALEYRNKSSGENAGIKCGGSLINNRYVLTTADCLLDFREFELISVRLGEWNISSDPDCIELIANKECADSVQILNIKAKVPHPYFSRQSRSNNIGLIQLEKDVQYSDYIRPICLSIGNLPPLMPESRLTVAGWGATENGITSDVKLKVDIPIVSSEACEEKLVQTKIRAKMFCAGRELGKDSCRGDSGAPLMRIYEDTSRKETRWYQEGIVSYGVLGCGRAGYPTVYTRISRYNNWILDVISNA